MEIVHYFLDIIKYVVSGVIIFYVAYNWFRVHINDKYNTQLLEYKRALQKDTLTFRFQAHERLILFLERINPAQSVMRVHVHGMTVKDFQNQLISDINSEFNHNVTQQLYVSDDVWKIVKRLKDDTIVMINSAAMSLPPNLPSKELAKGILEHVSQLDENPYDVAISIIKKDIHSIF